MSLIASTLREPKPPVTALFTHAALMGDIIGSEAAASTSSLHRTLNLAVDTANALGPDGPASPLTITLGDEFQGLHRSLSGSLAAMRSMRRTFLSNRVDCRFVLGVVRLETPLNQDRAWNMMGPGLAQTREKLADKRHPNTYRFYLPGEPAAEALLDAVGLSLTMVEQDWTPRQQEIVALHLAAGGSAPEMADSLGISASSFYKTLRSARLDFYGRQWKAVEGAIAILDRHYGFE